MGAHRPRFEVIRSTLLVLSTAAWTALSVPSSLLMMDASLTICSPFRLSASPALVASLALLASSALVALAAFAALVAVAASIAVVAEPAQVPASRRHRHGLRRWAGIGYKQPSAPDRPRPRSQTMPTYILLTTLTPEGVQTVKNNPQRIKEVNNEVEQLGAKVIAQWATLGHVDFISVVEAPDEGAMARISLELGSRGTARYETLAAIPIDDFISSL
jgi:uncharacterized protein with GYD domain